MTEKYTHTIAVSTYVWGMGTTIAEARKKAESQTGHPEDLVDWIFYRVSEEAYMDQYGRINYPHDTPPIEIERVGFGKEEVPTPHDECCAVCDSLMDTVCPACGWRRYE